MERFQGKEIIKAFYPTNTFNKTECDGFRCWFYPTCNVEGFNLILNRYSEVDLPTMDVYKVHANVITGQVVGFVFDCITKHYNEGPNFLCCYSGSFSSYKEKDLTSPLKFRYKIKELNLYSIDGRVSMASVPMYKEELEF